MANPEQGPNAFENAPLAAMGPDTEEEKQRKESMNEQLESLTQKMHKDFGVPEEAEKIGKESKKDKPLRTALEIATEKVEAGIKKEEILKPGEKSLKELQKERAKIDAKRERKEASRVNRIAKQIEKMRLKGEYVSYESVDALLAENGIQPDLSSEDTDSAKFMKEWDKKRAREIYDAGVEKFDTQILELKTSIKELKNLKKTEKGIEISKIEGRIKAKEKELEKLMDDRQFFMYKEKIDRTPEDEQVKEPEDEQAEKVADTAEPEEIKEDVSEDSSVTEEEEHPEETKTDPDGWNEEDNLEGDISLPEIARDKSKEVEEPESGEQPEAKEEKRDFKEGNILTIKNREFGKITQKKVRVAKVNKHINKGVYIEEVDDQERPSGKPREKYSVEDLNDLIVE